MESFFNRTISILLLFLMIELTNTPDSNSYKNDNSLIVYDYSTDDSSNRQIFKGGPEFIDKIEKILIEYNLGIVDDDNFSNHQTFKGGPEFIDKIKKNLERRGELQQQLIIIKNATVDLFFHLLNFMTFFVFFFTMCYCFFSILNQRFI